MRWCPRQVAKERLILVAANELHRLMEDRELCVGLAFIKAIATVASERDFTTVSNQVLGIERVGVNLVVVAKKLIETMFFGDSRCAATTNAPFAKTTRRVATLF